MQATFLDPRPLVTNKRKTCLVNSIPTLFWAFCCACVVVLVWAANEKIVTFSLFFFFCPYCSCAQGCVWVQIPPVIALDLFSFFLFFIHTLKSTSFTFITGIVSTIASTTLGNSGWSNNHRVHGAYPRGCNNRNDGFVDRSGGGQRVECLLSVFSSTACSGPIDQLFVLR